MLALATSLLLALSPTMAGPPVAAAASNATIDATMSFFLTGPSAAAQCTNAAVTTDQAGTITATRASSSYCQKQDGTYVLIDANKVVVEPDGIRTEPASSNRVPSSEGLSSNWTTLSNAAPDAPSADLDPMGGAIIPFASTVNGGYVESPAFTISSTTAVLSLWVMGGGHTVAFRLRDTTAGADRCTGTASAGEWATMAARPSVACSGLTSGNNHVVRLYPGGTTSTGTAYFHGVQVEPGTAVMTSYIPTSGTAASRAADAITVTTADNGAAGCVGAIIKATAPAFPQRLASRSGDVAAINSTSQIFTADGTNTVFTGGGVSNITDRSVPWRVQWGGSALSASLDTVGVGSGSFDGSMGSGTTLYVGSNSGVQVFHGWTKALKFSTSPGGCAP